MTTILIADDDHALRTLLRLLCETAGHTVHTVKGGQQLLDQAMIEQPDLIITDLDLPQLTGAEAIRQLRQRAPFEQRPIILVSGRLDVPNVARECGADVGLTKPFDLAAFERLLLDLLQMAEAARG